MRGLNLKGFKKVAEDEKTTTMAHPAGHHVIVAHYSVSPDLRRRLKELPIHKARTDKEDAEPQLAKGGEVHQSNPKLEQSKVRLAEGTPEPLKAAEYTEREVPEVPGPDPVAQAPDQNPEPEAPLHAEVEGQEVTAQTPDSALPGAPDAQDPNATPEAPDQGHSPEAQGTPAPEQQGPPSPGQQLLHDRDAFAEDLQNGHITPETYKSLFAKKDTLGKVGTIFGLMLSGLGSGLSGQPNALLHMMDNTINNDLEAQKTSKTNAQNFLKIHQQQQMNDATIKNMVKTGQLTDAQATNLRQSTANNALVGAKMAMQLSVLHDLYVKAGALPPGPIQQKAQQAVQGLSQQLSAEHQATAAQADQGANAFGGAGQASQQDLQSQQRAMRLSGDPEMAREADVVANRTIPGVPGQASRDIPLETRSRIQAQKVLDDKGRDVLNYVQQHTGSWNPSTRKVATQKIEEMKNFYNDSIHGGALTQGRLGWYDEQFPKHPTDILNQLMGSSAGLKEIVSSNGRRRDLELQGLGFDPNEGKVIINPKTGEKRVGKGGKWVPVK